MNEDMKIQLGSTLYDRINRMQMPETERQAALDAMRNARILVDAFLWVARSVERLGEFRLFKPSVGKTRVAHW